MGFKNRRRELLAIAAVGFGLTTAGIVGLTPASAAFGDAAFRYEGFSDLNDNGVRDAGEPLVSGSFIGFEGVGANNAWVNGSFNNVGSVGQTYYFPYGSYVELSEGPFAVENSRLDANGDDQMNTTGCEPTTLTTTIRNAEGETPFEDVRDDYETRFPQTKEPEYGVSADNYEVYTVDVGDELFFSQAFDCPDTSASGTAFDDANANGTFDEGETTFSGVHTVMDAVSPFWWNSNLEDSAESPLSQIWEEMGHAVVEADSAEDGSILIHPVGRFNDSPWRNEPELQDTFRYYRFVSNIPDGCTISSSSTLTRFGAGTEEDPHPEGFETNSSIVNDAGFWTEATYEVTPDDLFDFVDIAWGDQANVDVPLDCEDAVVPPDTTTTTTAPAPTTTTPQASTTAPVSTTTPVMAPATTTPVTSGGGIVVDTGSAGPPTSAVVSTVVGLLLVAGSLAGAFVLSRQESTS